ncbi:hypothetical protein ACFFKU_07905 [Kineococcus gynurae]|uniref:Uncharacterized protein n=1 Tax=Kineococcus gynurae TaxID=452979 RepID=A0ABV5LWC7_9ACTN
MPLAQEVGAVLGEVVIGVPVEVATARVERRPLEARRVEHVDAAELLRRAGGPVVLHETARRLAR